jgi:hypothetical protein
LGYWSDGFTKKVILPPSFSVLQYSNTPLPQRRIYDILGGANNMPAPKYKRILAKLSGETLMGDQSFGINPEMIN